jgi:anti-sigma-K factor RskA
MAMRRPAQARCAVPLPVHAPGGSAGWRRFRPQHFRWACCLGVGVPLVVQLEREQGQDTQLPESYVGVLATDAGKPGLIVSSLRRGRTVDLKLLQRQPLPEGQVFALWTLDAQGAAQAIGTLLPFGSNFVSMVLQKPAEEVFARAVELAVSVEPDGSLPARPSGAFVDRGLCGKLWLVKLVPASAAGLAAEE